MYYIEHKKNYKKLQTSKLPKVVLLAKKLMETSQEGGEVFPDLNRKYTVASDILFRQIDDEAILLHISSGTYYNLNETSIMFWEALADSKPLNPVVERIINEYEVEREYVLQDLQIFLQDLSQNQIITPSAA